MLKLVRMLLANPVVRAKALQYLRLASAAASAWVFTSTYVWITAHVHAISTADAGAIATVLSGTVGGLILAIGAAVYSSLDVEKVDATLKATQATTAAVVASRPDMASIIASQAAAVLAPRDEAAKQLRQTIAALKAGAA